MTLGGTQWNWLPNQLGHAVFTQNPVYVAKLLTERGDALAGSDAATGAKVFLIKFAYAAGFTVKDACIQKILHPMHTHTCSSRWKIEVFLL